MNSKEIAQQFHDLFTGAADGWTKELAGNASPEEITRGLMMGATSFAAAAWAASTKVSGVDHALTRATMTTAALDFYNQAIIPQTMRV